MLLSEDDFEWITAEVSALGVPIISVLEGGYNVQTLESCVHSHLRALIHT